MLLCDQAVPGSGIVGSPLAVGMSSQFEPAFIVFIHRLPELFGVCSMNQNGDLQLTGLLPDWCELGIVNLHAIAIDVFYREAKTLVNLKSVCSVLHVLLEYVRGHFTPAFLPHAFEINIGKNNKATGLVLLNVGDRFNDLLPALSTEVDHHLHIQLIHLSNQCA